ncbi:MAG: hypothetical protein PHU14_05055 [Methylovulum sp.]|nr:hypothetical protein [Methylovulum sp.]
MPAIKYKVNLSDDEKQHLDALLRKGKSAARSQTRARGWLNIAEIELAVLSNMCLSQRIPDKNTLRRKVNANVRERNLKATPVKWHFTTQDARRDMARFYPCVSK